MKKTPSAREKAILLIACAACILSALCVPWRGHALAQEEPMPKMIETFTLDGAHPSREFYNGRLRIELVSSKKTRDYLKSITVRISSDMLKAEYGNEWQEHTFLEMTDYYRGDPVSGSPFKCNEGWFYYVSSRDGEVTLSLHEGVQPVDSKSYTAYLFFTKNWKYLVMALAALGIALFLRYFIPLMWSFIDIQIQARAHALATGFESSTVIIYLIKTVPVVVCFYFFFDLFYRFGWKGVALAMLIAIGLQVYFNIHNKKQLATYARMKNLSAAEGRGNRAYTGQVKGMPVFLAVGGSFVGYSSSSEWSSDSTYMSYLIIQITLKNNAWNGLEISRPTGKNSGWESSLSLDSCPGAGPALAALSHLPKYSIGEFQVLDGKLTTVKMFAPDTPAEIHLLVDLVADLALSLDSGKKLNGNTGVRGV